MKQEGKLECSHQIKQMIEYILEVLMKLPFIESTLHSYESVSSSLQSSSFYRGEGRRERRGKRKAKNED
jgi:hypothetical protein